MSQTIHLGVSVVGVQRWSDRDLEKLFKDGTTPTKGRIIRQWLKLQEAKGILMLPMGEKCEGWSDVTGCPGHEDPATP